MAELSHETRIPVVRSETLDDENKRLRELVVTLSAIVLKNATGGFEGERLRAGFSAGGPDLIQFAEKCFSFARMPGIGQQVAVGLENIGHSLMAKAVEVESVLQREKWNQEKKFPSNNTRPAP